MLKSMWEDGAFGKCMLIFIIAMVVLLISLPVVIYYDRLEMTAQHCTPTNQTREYQYIQTIYGANAQIIAMIPMTGTERLYTCDDVNRWR